MKIKVLGSGSAFTLENFQTNFLIESDDCKNNLLIDCGSDIRFSLKEQGLSYLDIKNVYISHLHADHCGGLEYLAFCSYFDTRMKDKKIRLFAHYKLIDDLWNHSLSGGLSSIEGNEMKLGNFFRINDIHMHCTPYCLPGIGTLKIVQTIHVMNGYSIVPTFGLMIKTDSGTSKTVYFTTDTQFSPDQITVFYNQSDIIIQDCETSPYESKVHAHYNKLKTLPAETKAKMYLVHYQDGNKPDAIADGFKGFLKKGEIIEVSIATP